MTSWLDTETKALLEGAPPDKLAPPDTAEYTLVLLSIWPTHRHRLLRAFERIRVGSRENAARHLKDEQPVVVASGLTHAEALLGQFELISCDAISIFIRDNIAESASRIYLRSLFDTLLESDEFANTRVSIERLPDDEHGSAFIDQFLGTRRPSLPAEFRVLQKKARIMSYWGNKIGGTVTYKRRSR